ncbi:hypothetical protein H3V17_00810 [Bartonella sp. M0283]|uniref:hypothetical protein n=1 Tax=Bartonella sp. M0283 TaxID=2751016 RepID=UPI0018DD2516|nr:hypothetical protein [Bartonella sp. M0283]MBI0162194.1 hypothetical protein [Bartonella sp. M0283]
MKPDETEWDNVGRDGTRWDSVTVWDIYEKANGFLGRQKREPQDFKQQHFKQQRDKKRL